MEQIIRITRVIACLPIKFYQIAISPSLGQKCRFYPSCSEYALNSIMQLGIIKGFVLAMYRLCRCHPWAQGGYDPVLSKKEND